jgi:hypothetical protein
MTRFTRLDALVTTLRTGMMPVLVDTDPASPSVIEEIAVVCNRRKVAYVPGAATPADVRRVAAVRSSRCSRRTPSVRRLSVICSSRAHGLG